LFAWSDRKLIGGGCFTVQHLKRDLINNHLQAPSTGVQDNEPRGFWSGVETERVKLSDVCPIDRNDKRPGRDVFEISVDTPPLAIGPNKVAGLLLDEGLHGAGSR